VTGAVRVDERLCARTGYCVRIAPDVFELPGAGAARVRTSLVDDDHVDAAAEAAEVCPLGAIEVRIDAHPPSPQEDCNR